MLLEGQFFEIENLAGKAKLEKKGQKNLQLIFIVQ
jgi:hypothetical protein